MNIENISWLAFLACIVGVPMLMVSLWASNKSSKTQALGTIALMAMMFGVMAWSMFTSSQGEHYRFQKLFGVQMPKTDVEHNAVRPIIADKLNSVVQSNDVFNVQIDAELIDLQHRVDSIQATTSNIESRTKLFQQIQDLQLQKQKHNDEFGNELYKMCYLAWYGGFGHEPG